MHWEVAVLVLIMSLNGEIATTFFYLKAIPAPNILSQIILSTFISATIVGTQWIFSNSDFQKDIMLSVDSESLDTSYSAELVSHVSTVLISNDIMQSFQQMENSVIYLFPSNTSSLVDTLTKIGEFLGKSFTQGLWEPTFMIMWPREMNDEDETNNIMKLLQNGQLNISVESDVYILVYDFLGDWYKILSMMEVYTIKTTLFVKPISLTHVKQQSAEKLGFYRILRKVFRRQNFNRVPITVIEMFTAPQFAREISVKNGTTTFLGGYDIEQFWYLRDSLNFRGIEMEAEGWIGSYPNGTPKGMNAQVINDDADLCIASSFAYYDEKLFFLHPIQTAYLYAFFVQPTGVSIRDIYFRPFKLQLWITVIAVWTLAAIAVFIIVKLKKLKGDVSFADEYMFDGAIFWVFSSLTSKGWETTPDSLSLKLVMLSGMLLSLLTMTVYTSILTSYLSVEIPPIQNFGDLLTMGFTIYAGSYSTVTTYSINANTQTKKAKTKTLTEKKAVDALPIVLRSTSAFVGIIEEYSRAINEIPHNKRYNQISKVLVSPVKTKAGAFVKRGSRFKEFFNYKIISLFENGIRYRIMGKSSRTFSAEENNASFGYNQRKISLSDAIIPVVILSVGYLLSIIITGIERIIKSANGYYLRNQKRHNCT